MHDLLYEHQDALEDDDLRRYTEDLGLDTTEFERSVFEEHLYSQHIKKNFKSGIHSGVNGTPTFFVNGTRYDGALTEDDLSTLIENAMIE